MSRYFSLTGKGKVGTIGQGKVPRVPVAGGNAQHSKGQVGKSGRHTHTSPRATGGIYQQDGWMEWEEGCNLGHCQCL